MSRFHRALKGVLSSYILLGAITVYTLASVPVALHYLDAKRFGLWIVMGTLSGYLNLIDAGMTGAAARLLIDYKDDRDGGIYGSLIKTAWLVSTIQGGIIFLLGLLMAGTFSRLLGISSELNSEFIRLVNWQCGAIAVLFCTRICGVILDAHQRMDLTNYVGVLGLLGNFAAQWIFFHYGFGLISLALGAITAVLLVVICQLQAIVWLRLIPCSHGWGRVSWLLFQELFNYGKDVFLVSVGTQLIMASQTIIIARALGLEAAGMWGVGLRVFNLLNQLVWRLYDMSAAALAELLARGELSRLGDRYRSLAMLSFSLAGWAGVSFAMCNSLFITLWTHGKIHWPVQNDLLLALWMVVCAAVHCHNSFVIMTKKIAAMRYIYFIEGAAFVVMAVLTARRGGLAAIISCSIFCSICFSGAYGAWRISHFFVISSLEVALDWFRPMAKVILFYLPVAGMTWWLLFPAPTLLRLTAHALLAASLGLYLLALFGIPRPFQRELLERMPAKTIPFLKRVLLFPAK